MKLTHQTKIVYSLEGKWLASASAADLGASRHIDSLRIIYGAEHHDAILNFIPKLKATDRIDDGHLSLMLDVGSKRRAWLKKLNGKKDFVYGDLIKLSRDEKKEVDILIDGHHIDEMFATDATIYFGFGLLVMKIKNIEGGVIEASVVQGGSIDAGVEIHVPHTRKPPSLQDLAQIDVKSFAVLGVDYVVLPGFHSRKELTIVRKHLAANGAVIPWLLLKIDDINVFSQLSQILEEVDGVLISRSDLALTMDPANVPEVCKEIVRLCNEQAKLVMIASEMLGSMRFNPTPTRAEVSDIANAVYDGVDAVVLSEDIAQGRHQERALALCQSIILDVEAHYTETPINWQKQDFGIRSVLQCVSLNALKTAKRLAAKAIVCITKEGNTALRLASFKPPLPIVAVTFSEKTKKRLSLVRGVYAIYLDLAPNLDDVLPKIDDRLKEEDWLESGDTIVFVTVSLSSMGQEASNLFTVQRLS